MYRGALLPANPQTLPCFPCTMIWWKLRGLCSHIILTECNTCCLMLSVFLAGLLSTCRMHGGFSA